MAKAPLATPKATLLRSMTGYAEAVLERDGITLTVSVRSVNHRFLDLHVHLPEALLPWEGKVRREVQGRGPRGHLELRVTLERAAGTSWTVDEALVGRYIELFRRLGKQHQLPAETDVATLCRLPGVINLTGGELDRQEFLGQFEVSFFLAIREALNRWDEMRAAEAQFLLEDLRERVSRVRDSLSRLERLREEVVPLAQQRFQERLQALVGQAGMEASRLAQEAAILADRADTSEELLRLKSHLTQFGGLLEGEPDAGRKLDFLLQEIHRELNTFLSKSAGLGEGGLPLTEVGLEIKAEVEKLREQVQNFQ